MAGLHLTIQYSFLIVGHTKFAPDACFGMIKKKFRRTRISCLQDLAEVVNTSADLNHAQLVGSQSGNVIVPTYDWKNHFAGRFRMLTGIKRLHHITITSTPQSQLSISVKEFSDSPTQVVSLVKDPTWNPLPSELPPVILPTGLDAKRQWYLYNEVREYCTDNTKDLVCPLPSVPLRSHDEQEEEEEEVEDEEEQVEAETRLTVTVPTVRQRHCRTCHQVGHNSRTCPLR